MNPPRRLRRALVCAVLAVSCLGFAASAQGSTVCASGCDFTTISAATAAAASGDTITVSAGTYTEPTGIHVINKALTINGAGSGTTIVDGNSTATATPGQLEIRTGTGQNVSVSGLTIREPVVGSSTYGIFAKSTDASGPTYTFNDIKIVGNASGDEYGLYTDNSTATLVFNNGSVSNTRFNPILIEEPRAATSVTNSAIAGGTGGGGYANFKSNPSATGLDTTAKQLVSGNTFSNGAGVGFTSDLANNGSGGYTDIEVANNSIVNAGVSLTNSATTAPNALHARIAGAVVRGNRITGTGARGVSVRGFVQGAQVTGNYITGHTDGIGTRVAATGGHQPLGLVVHANRIAGNTTGLANGATTAVNAEENWWGCNEGPNNGGGCDPVTGSNVDFNPWLVLDIAGPPSVNPPATATFTASIDQTSDGTPASAPNSFPGGNVAWAASAGTITTPTAFTNSVTTTTFTPPPSGGPVTVSATFDAETVSTSIAIITQCADGIDNDGNGRIDFPADLGCSAPGDTTEGSPVSCPSNVNGTNGNDTFIGDDSPNRYSALGGDDTLYGQGGADCLFGGNGGDFVFGGTGADLLDGGGGGDLIRGESGADVIYGGAGGDQIEGGDGDDLINPEAGTDLVNAGAGDDRVFARDGTKDNIDCGPGNDVATVDANDTVVNCETVQLPVVVF